MRENFLIFRVKCLMHLSARILSGFEFEFLFFEGALENDSLCIFHDLIKTPFQKFQIKPKINPFKLHRKFLIKLIKIFLFRQQNIKNDKI